MAELRREFSFWVSDAYDEMLAYRQSTGFNRDYRIAISLSVIPLLQEVGNRSSRLHATSSSPAGMMS